MQTLLQKHAAEALKSCGRASWDPQPVYDHEYQLYSLASIEDQMGGYVASAEPLVKIIITGWCLTGKMPRSKGLAVYFTRVVLEYAVASECLVRPGDLPDEGPIWTVKQTAKFLSIAVDPWFRRQSRDWAHEAASAAFDLQESVSNLYRRYD